ncbi:hypothetical protein [Lentibacillus cibarius]|uniref:DUF3990 domain-containing protein n=1 Tax=Lentibacillus cibarius TaxID=2583219 RepID=A0A5S3QJL5_9BACI|nr:hypothetical protein [Lentibacillus cibarius]TMN21927.1 hypothetical protein FFL34_07205 [Lentibacillus cibarius]
MDYDVVINGFHGTDNKVAVAIEQEKTYTYSKRSDHWLGQGIYFFSEDPEQAMSWAMNQTKQGDTATVLFTKIVVNSSSFLNLNSRSGIFTLKKLINKLGSEYSIESYSDDQVGNTKLRCFIMDLLPDNIKAIQKNFYISTQPQFVLNTPEMGRMGISMQSAQVCVRDSSIISRDTIEIFESKKKPFKKRKRREVNFK